MEESPIVNGKLSRVQGVWNYKYHELASCITVGGRDSVG